MVDVALDAHDNLQCIWCGMFMGKVRDYTFRTDDTYLLHFVIKFKERSFQVSLAMHYHEVHAEDIEVPKCRLCIEVGDSHLNESTFGLSEQLVSMCCPVSYDNRSLF